MGWREGIDVEGCFWEWVCRRGEDVGGEGALRNGALPARFDGHGCGGWVVIVWISSTWDEK